MSLIADIILVPETKIFTEEELLSTQAPNIKLRRAVFHSLL